MALPNPHSQQVTDDAARYDALCDSLKNALVHLLELQPGSSALETALEHLEDLKKG